MSTQQPLDPPRANEPAIPARRTWRFVAALAVALASDAIGVPLEAFFPLMVALDVVTAIALWLLLGRGLVLLIALVLEAIPGVGLMPFWTLAVIGAQVLTSTTQARLDGLRGGASRRTPPAAP